MRRNHSTDGWFPLHALFLTQIIENAKLFFNVLFSYIAHLYSYSYLPNHFKNVIYFKCSFPIIQLLIGACLNMYLLVLEYETFWKQQGLQCCHFHQICSFTISIVCFLSDHTSSSVLTRTKYFDSLHILETFILQSHTDKWSLVNHCNLQLTIVCNSFLHELCTKRFLCKLDLVGR